MAAFKKYIAEFIGTFILVLFGCGTAALTGGIDGKVGILGISLAFGLSIVAAAYAIGDISGCHINPAVSLAMLINGKLSVKDFFGYVIAQLLGACAASSTLVFIITSTNQSIFDTGLGTNGYGSLSYLGVSAGGAFAVELILTFVFILTILGVTSNEKTSSHAGIVIGLTLCFVHIIGIALTGTSVNPARSFGPAIIYGGEALGQLWLFIVAPMLGAAIAAVLWRFFLGAKLAEKKPDKAPVQNKKKK